MSFLFGLSVFTVLLACSALWIVYVFAQAIQRLFFSPIAKFPGPKLAAVSFWYEFYYDICLGGQYTFKIIRMHEEYGPIIRINPYELHVASPNFIEKLYTGPGKRRNRWSWYTSQVNMPESIFGTVDHDTHRIRRAAISPFFSKGAVRKLQPVVDERIEALMTRIDGFQAAGSPMNLTYAFSALTNDIVQEYAFARSGHRMEEHDFEPSFHHTLVKGSAAGAIIKQYPWALPAMESLPDYLMTWLDSERLSFINFQRGLVKQIKEIKAGKVDDTKDVDHRTIFYEMINSNLPEREKSDARLAQDGSVVVTAGTLTTAWTLCVALYYLLSQPELLRKLKEELRTAQQGTSAPLSLIALEQLPYLTGCIQESIRLSYGICSRIQRIAPDETLVFNDGKVDWLIPPGTPVGMTSVLVHHDESVFPDSRSFLPERWIAQPNLDKYLLSFSKGTRICLGINLAYAELYLTLSRIFSTYGSKDVRDDADAGYLELFETTAYDMELTKDVLIPVPPDDSKGVRIMVNSY